MLRKKYGNVQRQLCVRGTDDYKNRGALNTEVHRASIRFAERKVSAWRIPVVSLRQIYGAPITSLGLPSTKLENEIE